MGPFGQCRDTPPVNTAVNGSVYETCTSLPFGDYQQCSAADPTPYHFTGLERDPETANDHALFRTYDSAMGRSLSPDPLGGDVSNPQSLNRYAYALNSPCSYTDPLGLDSCNFNVRLANPLALPDDEVNQIEQRINNLFGATKSPNGDTVGINFVTSGEAAATLTLTNANWFERNIYPGYGTFGVEGGYYGNPEVWMNTNPGATSAAVFAGSVGAHELAHTWLGGHVPYDSEHPNIMMFGRDTPVNVFGDALIIPGSPLWKFTPAQVSTLFQTCRSKPGSSPSPSRPGSGPGGGGSEGWAGGNTMGYLPPVYFEGSNGEGGSWIVEIFGGATVVLVHRK